MTFAERYGPWAAVTGAGQGIGAAFAADLVSRGVNVVLIDRDVSLLAARAGELAGADVEVRTSVVDLAHPEAASEVLHQFADIDLGLFISNAALSFEGPILEQGLDHALTQLHVNCRVPLTVMHALLPSMVARGRGGIILPESVSEELRGTGVDVMALLPGSTRTPGWLGSRPQASLGTSNVMEPADVAREALDALGTVPSIIAGQENRESEAFMESLDRAEAIKIMGDVMRQMYPPVRDTDPTV